jgi:hypothetical protein
MKLDRPAPTSSAPDATIKTNTNKGLPEGPSTGTDAFSGYSLKDFDSLLNELESQKRQNVKLRSSSLS